MSAVLNPMTPRLPLVVALLLAAGPAQAAWTRIGALAVGNDTTQDTSLVVATSATLEAGNVGVCVIASDEGGTGTTDGDNGEIVSVQDDAGNTWVEGIEFCNMQTSTINNGACVAIWYTKATTELTSGSNITVTLFDSSTDPRKALVCEEFTITNSTYLVSETAGDNGAAYDALNVDALQVATGVSSQHLFIRGNACESDDIGDYSDGAGYTDFGGSDTTATADAGAAAVGMGARGGSRIATESTSAFSNPDYPSGNGSADCASAMIGLNETAPGACTAGLNMTLLGVGGCP